jgi:hypothetical protein
MITHYAAIGYPSEFPCFVRDNYAMDLDLGLIRTNSDVLINNQRRAYTNLPTVISATVVIKAAQLHDFTMWMNENVGIWVELPLTHPFITHGNLVEDVPGRIIDFTFANAYQDFGTILGLVTIQLSPSVFSDNIFTGGFGWVIAGRVTAPAAEWLLAGRVTNPSGEWTIAGSVVEQEVLADGLS